MCTFSMGSPKDSSRFAKDGFLTTSNSDPVPGEAEVEQAKAEPDCGKHDRRYLLQS